MRHGLAIALLSAAFATAQEGNGGPAIEGPAWNRVEASMWQGMLATRLPDGGKIACERDAIRKGLVWLANHQSRDGSWQIPDRPDVTVAVTSLSVLAMVGNANTLRAGPHKASVKKAIAWLRKQQSGNGAFSESSGPHLLASQAMAECYLMSDYKLIRKATVKAVQYAATLRCPDGGWAPSLHSEDSDPSLTLWGTNLLMATADAGFILEQDACSGVFDWLLGARSNLAPRRGILGVEAAPIRQAELSHDQAAANAFTLCFVALKDVDARRAAAAIRDDALTRGRALPRKWVKNPRLKLSINEWFCTAHALTQAGDHEAVAAITRSLAKSQVAKGQGMGSWEPIGAWGDVGGRTWTTAMAVLTLEAPYRFAKIKGR